MGLNSPRCFLPGLTPFFKDGKNPREGGYQHFGQFP
jgi:hypothetical protein